MPAGDQTEIGENGVTLSGGQKARVALARAVYQVRYISIVSFLKLKPSVFNRKVLFQNKSVYLLDDPLAAVDAHVAKHLFDQCVLGLLAKKTRILCTHHVKFLRRAHFVVVLQDGKVVKQGGNNND